MTPSQARDQYDAQGYVIIRGALKSGELKRVQDAFDRAQENDALGDILNQDDVFVDMVDHPALLPVVRAVVGEDAQLRAVHCQSHLLLLGPAIHSAPVCRQRYQL